MKTQTFSIPLIGLLMTVSVSCVSREFQACYLPTQSNISYTEVLELAVASPNAVISYGSDALQFAELWLPPGATQQADEFKYPLLVLVHGGCWLNEYDITHTHALSTALSQAGYAVWAMEYRRTGDKGGGWPGSYQDVKAAIEYIPQLQQYPLLLDKIALAGHSAGGHLALLAAGDPELDSAISIVAIIGLAPIIDLVEYSKGANDCQIATAKFMGGSAEELPQQYALATVANKPLISNAIVLHGTADNIVPISQSRNSGLKTLPINGAGHFDMIHPGTPAFQALLQQLASAFQP